MCLYFLVSLGVLPFVDVSRGRRTVEDSVARARCYSGIELDDERNAAMASARHSAVASMERRQANETMEGEFEDPAAEIVC